ncbi:MAG: PadR family transcriptional regulator [Clostridia bacterium]|nr:PadR family transcriptional regulator [Clostridia bacterium]
MEEKSKISSDLIRGHIDTIILYSLMDSDKFAQQISDFIDEKSEKKYQINQATLYSSLKRLENLKYVSSYWYDVDDGRRKFFKITDLGKSVVNDNLSSWTESRVIIDKLMGCSYTPSVFVSHKEFQKSDEITSEIKIESTEIKEDKPQVDLTQESKENSQKEGLNNNEVNSRFTSPFTQSPYVEEKPDLNFRSVLNGLIKSAEKLTQKDKDVAKKEMIDLSAKIKSEPEVLDEPIIAKFNETIKTRSYTSKEPTTPIKTDFNSLIEENALDGYKIRVSTKNSSKNVGNLLVNKLSFFTTLFFILVPIIEITLVGLITQLPIFSNVVSLVFMGLNVASLIVSAILYLTNKHKTANKIITYDRVLTSAIIVFNLFLLIFALNFTLNVDLTQTLNLISYVLLPVLLSVNLVVYFFIENLLFKSKRFLVKS